LRLDAVLRVHAVERAKHEVAVVAGHGGRRPDRVKHGQVGLGNELDNLRRLRADRRCGEGGRGAGEQVAALHSASGAGRRERVDFRQWQLEVDAGQPDGRVGAAGRLERPCGRVARHEAVDVGGVIVLEQFDDLGDTLDLLQVPPFAVAASPVPDLRRTDDLEQHAWVLAASDRHVRDARGIALLGQRPRGAAHLRAAV
jgi:hypothetical protein